MRLIEHHDPRKRDIREILRDAYAEGGNLTAAAGIVGINGGTFSVWVRQLGGEIASEVRFPDLECACEATA